MKHLNFVWLLLFFPCCVSMKESPTGLKEFHFAGFAQGTTWHITYFARDSFVRHEQFDSLFNKIDSSLSIYKSYSLISRFNEAPGEIEMDAHLKIVVQKSLEIYTETGGISDITVYPIVRAWGFGTQGRTELPDSATIKNLLPCVGSDKIFIDHSRLRKTKPCIKIDVNGIAQGYTVDVIADFLEKENIQNWLVEVGGELRIKGHKHPGHSLFQVGIESPADNSFAEPIIKKIIQFEKGAVTTSGNYRKYFEKGGKVISHLMNPKNGYPVQNELVSVTVWAKDAITADGFDNALMGMGLENSFLFLRKHKNMEAYFIYHKPNGSVADTATAGFYKMLKR
ncbi:MAG: FAD:protein transferase [Chitinophagaceae bacterium]|nr:FAD:protein transferase [Chitinophagaceae bacterium]